MDGDDNISRERNQMAEKFQVLTSGSHPDQKFSVVQLTDAGYMSRRQKLVTFIPDAGSENNATQVARLLNKEHQELVERRAKQEAEEAAAREKVVNGDVDLV